MGALIGILIVLYIIERLLNQYSGLFIALGIISVGAYVLYRINKKEKAEKLHQMQFEQAVHLPAVHRKRINGSFRCPQCGSYLQISNEEYPRTSCEYCHSMIPEIMEMIDQRDKEYNEAVNRRETEQRNRRQDMLMQRQKQEIEADTKRRVERNKTVALSGIAIFAITVCGILLALIAVLFFSNLPTILEYAAKKQINIISSFIDAVFKR